MDIEDDKNEVPFLLKVLPFVIAGATFGHLYLFKKRGFKFSSGIASVVLLITAIPWIKGSMSGKTSVAPGSVTDHAVNDVGDIQPLASSAANSDNSMTAHLNAMDKPGRKYAVDYIIAQENKMEASKKYFNGDLPSVENRIAAFNTLTNDELKVLYCVYHFIEDRKGIYDKYGSTQNEKTARLVAKQVYGIDLTAINDIENVASIAITKTLSALNAGLTQ